MGVFMVTSHPLNKKTIKTNKQKYIDNVFETYIESRIYIKKIITIICVYLMIITRSSESDGRCKVTNY